MCMPRHTPRSFAAKDIHLPKPIPKRRAKQRPDNLIHSSWKESRAFCGPYPQASRRFYKLETLISALEKMLGERDRFLHAELSACLDHTPLNTLSGDLVFEDNNRFVYMLESTSRTRNRAVLRLCVAKNHQECSTFLRKEWEALALLGRRASGQVINVRSAGSIFLPDRYRRKDINREVFAYITDAAPGGPLYVASDTQLGPRGPQPRRFSIADTEALKASLVRLTAACYDARDGTGFDPADLHAECLALRRQPEGTPEVFLLNCPRLRRRLRPEKLLRHLVFGVLTSERHTLPLAPARHEHFFEALAAGASRETARDWCITFLKKTGPVDAINNESLPGRSYLNMLAEYAQAY